MSRTRRPCAVVVALAATALLATACGDAGDGDGASPGEPTEAGAGGITVVATTSILGDIVTELVGDAGEVEVLMPPGVDPHAFSPSAAQAAAVRDADLVVANGLGLEESLIDLLEAAEEDGARVLELAPALDPLAFDGAEEAHTDEDGHAEDASAEDDGHGHADEDDHATEEDDHATEEDPHGHAHGDGDLDPHVWFDPVRMADGAGIIADALAEVDDALDDDEWERRGADYAARLVALDEEIRDTLATIPAERRILITNHEAIGYLAARYDLEIVGTVIPGGGTLASADAGRVAELAELVRDRGVPAIFAENTTDDRLAQALAREVGRDVEVVTLYTDALGEAGSGAETYIDLLRTDAQLIADALG